MTRKINFKRTYNVGVRPAQQKDAPPQVKGKFSEHERPKGTSRSPFLGRHDENEED